MTMSKIDKLSKSKTLHKYIRYPGERSGIRFFDATNREDMKRLRKIVKSKKVIEWMDDTRLTDHEIIKWGKEKKGNSYLFAVVGIPPTVPEKEAGKVQGFVYFYTGRREKSLVKRLVKSGLLPEKALGQMMFEISTAKLPAAPNGQMASATRQACLEVKKLVTKETGKPALAQFFGFIDPENVKAIRAAEAAGYKYIGRMKYDADSPVEQNVYLLDWRKLKAKVKGKAVKTQISA